MARRALLVASALTAAVDGKSMIQWQTQCRALLESFVGRSAFEVAAVCRSKIPTDICREVSQDLGAQPWAPGKLLSTCRKWENLWAPRVRSKARSLGESISAKLLPTATSTTVDASTGVKCLTGSPWEPQPAGTNAFTVPIYMLSSSLQDEPYVPPGPQVGLVARADTTPPPSGNIINGTLEVTRADGESFEEHNDTVGAFSATIAEIAGVSEEAISISGISVSGSSASVRYTIECPSYISTVTISHNLVFTNKPHYEDVLNETVGQTLLLNHSFVQDAYGGKHVKPVLRSEVQSNHTRLDLLQSQLDQYAVAATAFAQNATVSLPDAIAPQGVLGSVRLTVSDVSKVPSDFALQSALTSEVANAATVEPSGLLVTSVQLTPTITKSGSISPAGEVQMFFAVNTTDAAMAARIQGNLQASNASELTLHIRQALAAAGAEPRGLAVEDLGARIAADMADVQPSREALAAVGAVAAAEAKWAAAGQRRPAAPGPARAAVLALCVAALLASGAGAAARRRRTRTASGHALLPAGHLVDTAGQGRQE